jgi:predicted RNA-binding Zn ribbon-like protein
MIKIDKDDRMLNLKARRLCLEFANTAEWHAGDRPIEQLNSYAELVTWAEQAGLLTGAEARQTHAAAAPHPEEAAARLEQAIILREAIYRIFSAVAGGRPPDPADLATVNAALTTALSHLQVVQSHGHFVWGWHSEAKTALDQMLWPVIRSAAELLTSEALDRVRECADDRGCGYLFMDLSRNRSRKWCDMRGCGNRAKARRHYRRTQAEIV